MVAETMKFKQNRRRRVLKTKENSFVFVHHLKIIRWLAPNVADGFPSLIPKTLKLGNLYVDKEMEHDERKLKMRDALKPLPD